MSREISEDLLYVQLNLLLAILINTYIYNKYIESESDKFNIATFTLEIEELINKHIKEHYEGYLCLQDLREYYINHLNDEDIKYLYDNYLRNDIENKEFKASITEKLKSSKPISLIEKSKLDFIINNI